MMIPIFQQFREMGVKDKAPGVSAETAQQRIKEIHSEEIIQSLRTTTTIEGRKYTNSDITSQEKM
ncbi:Exc2 family lipoprotein, partial [Klebsiella pneumoniae]